MVKDKINELIRLRKRLAKQMPDPSTALAGSLMSRMIRCNKSGCRFCEKGKGKGKGHGPISILSVSSADRRVRQIPIPTHLRRFAEIQALLKQISRVNQDLLEERKKR